VVAAEGRVEEYVPMPDTKAPQESDSGQPNGTSQSQSRTAIISAVKNPLGFFVLVVLIVEVIFGGIVLGGGESVPKGPLIYGMLLLIFLLVVLVAAMSVLRPMSLYGIDDGSRPLDMECHQLDQREIVRRLTTSPKIVGEKAPPPPANVWFEDLRPLLHQAIHYTVPTYYLDVDLRVIDWNIAFELIFSELAGLLRGQHVKQFIARMQNYDEMIAHAQRFTKKVFKGQIPFVDVEPIEYLSQKYGPVRFLKVAVQLHDAEGRLRGWSVSLLIREIDWKTFQEDLLEMAQKDKLWSVYSASYDRVLLEFPPYKKLIDDIIAVVPERPRSVVDLGAGTGNVTRALLDAGYVVTAVENNLPMLNRLRSKLRGESSLTVVKSSVENLSGFSAQSFDAAVMVNVLYAVDEPLSCLQEVHRILKPQGVLGFSTTHSEIDLDPLLASIKARLEEIGKYDELADDYKVVYDLNKAIEKGIAKRYTRDEYRDWVRAAGFEIIKDVPNTYEDAVMLIHARKKS
jgi:ubiquinone/menaquinone biosynthesis C-methylase UbiE